MIEGMTVVEATRRRRELEELICNAINEFQNATGTYVISVFMQRPKMDVVGQAFGATAAVSVRVGLTPGTSR